MSHRLLRDDGILVVEPSGALEAVDFEALASVADPYIEEHGDLLGLLIETESFPGWSDFAGLVGHVRFVRNHHKYIKKVAVVTNSVCGSIAPKVSLHLVSAEVRHFHFGKREVALSWLREA